jgi:hypothetical protein
MSGANYSASTSGGIAVAGQAGTKQLVLTALVNVPQPSSCGVTFLADPVVPIFSQSGEATEQGSSTIEDTVGTAIDLDFTNVPAGTITVTFTNDGGFTNPPPLLITVSAGGTVSRRNDQGDSYGLLV